MARNELCSQDYCWMIIDFIDKRVLRFWKPFGTVEEVVKYCIKKTKVLDNGDEVIIREVVKSTLESLKNYAYLDFDGEEFAVYGFIPRDKYIAIFENPKTSVRNIDKSIKDKINDIDNRTRYQGDNFGL